MSEALRAPWERVENPTTLNPLHPFTMATDLMKLQQAGAQLRQVQQEWNARGRFGALATQLGGDTDKLLEAAQRDPLIGAWAPQLMTELRQQSLLDYQVEEIQNKLTATGDEGLYSFMSSTSYPAKFIPAFDSYFAKMTPKSQAANKPYFDSIRSALTDGLPEDPTAAAEEFNRRRAPLMVATRTLPNMESAAAAAGLGTARIMDVGGHPTPIVQDLTTGRIWSPGATGPSLQMPMPAQPAAAPAAA